MYKAITYIVVFFFAFLRLEQWRDSVAQERHRPAGPGPQNTRLSYRTGVVLLAFAGYVGLSNGIGAELFRDVCYGPHARSGAECLDKTLWQLLKLVLAYTAAQQYLSSKHGIVQTLMSLRNGRSGADGPSRTSYLGPNVPGRILDQSRVTGERAGD
ncbi:hypothetical protein KVT40_003447 [Elsinoe batatas]|uniref:Uncharacterized protein n=1 Tax=Elsinoe batatas TaxID=2601811 RepID=A0A8K0PIJ3_9PEZI|nr:hypothetical protein KVT40_003447 [Elsinoe batatas]